MLYSCLTSPLWPLLTWPFAGERPFITLFACERRLCFQLPCKFVLVCRKWGQNRVQEHHSIAPLQLILPVLTEQAVVHNAVSTLHCGKIRLSLSNVEPILVLANAIGVSATVAQQCFLR